MLLHGYAYTRVLRNCLSSAVCILFHQLRLCQIPRRQICGGNLHSGRFIAKSVVTSSPENAAIRMFNPLYRSVCSGFLDMVMCFCVFRLLYGTSGLCWAFSVCLLGLMCARQNERHCALSIWCVVSLCIRAPKDLCAVQPVAGSWIECRVLRLVSAEHLWSAWLCH